MSILGSIKSLHSTIKESFQEFYSTNKGINLSR